MMDGKDEVFVVMGEKAIGIHSLVGAEAFSIGTASGPTRSITPRVDVRWKPVVSCVFTVQNPPPWSCQNLRRQFHRCSHGGQTRFGRQFLNSVSFKCAHHRASRLRRRRRPIVHHGPPHMQRPPINANETRDSSVPSAFG